MEKRDQKDHESQITDAAGVIERNIQSLLHHRHRQELDKTRGEHLAHWMTRFTGSMTFVYFHITVFGLWIAINLEWLRIIAPFDRKFVFLPIFTSIEAIFLSTFVLINQNRMQAVEKRRADLALQVSLLSEHEITRVVGLVTKIASKMGIAEAHDPELASLAREVTPEDMLEKMESHERQFHGNGGIDKPKS